MPRALHAGAELLQYKQESCWSWCQVCFGVFALGCQNLGRLWGSDKSWCEHENMCGGESGDGIHLGHDRLIQISFHLVQSINSMFISNW